MKSVILVSMLVALLLSCGESSEERPKKFDTPEAAFAEVQAACRDRDVGRLFDLCCKKDRVEMQDIKGRLRESRFRTRSRNRLARPPIRLTKNLLSSPPEMRL